MRLAQNLAKNLLVILSLFSIVACAQTLTKTDTPKRIYDAELSNFIYPYPVSFFEFTSQEQSLRMAYMDVLPKHANGQTVVLLHGKNFSGAYWEPTIDALSTAGFRVIVPDQIGFGKSSKPVSYQFTFQALAENTSALLQKLGVDKAVIVGHSMGGMLATRFALMYPQISQKLILVNPLGLEDPRPLIPYQDIDVNYAQELKANPQSIYNYQKEHYFAGRWKPSYDALTDYQAGWTKDPDYPKVAWDAALTADMIVTQPVLYEFPLLKLKTLLIIGQRDRTVDHYPELARAAAKKIKHSKLVEIKEAGHLPQVEQFGLYKVALLKFLGK